MLATCLDALKRQRIIKRLLATEAAPRRLNIVWLYYIIMASPAVVTALLGLLAGGPLHVDDMVTSVLPAMAVAGLAGAHHFTSLVRRPEVDIRSREDALTRLPRHSALFTIAHTALLIGGHHVLSHQDAAVLGQVSAFAYPLALIGVYGVLLSLSLYFLVGALLPTLRFHLGLEHSSERWSSFRLVHRVTLALIGSSLAPVTLGLVHRDVVAAMPQLHAHYVDALATFDLAACLLVVGAAFLFVRQSLAEPVEGVLRAMRLHETGALDARASVLTDDELGAVAAGFNRMMTSASERAFVRETLGRFVPESVAAAVLRDRGVVRPTLREATILYTDMVGFTARCETLEPTEIVEMLNEYFSIIAKPVRDHGGVVTQFQGDAILAVFNVPQPVPEHAARAVSAARKIQQTVANNTFKGERMSCRIGIATGPIIAGNVGALGRLNYTVHGDAVNLAARLEQLCKTQGTNLLIAGSTVSCITDVDFEPVAYITARGQSNSVMTYTIN